MESDYATVGEGVVGLAVASRLLCRGRSVPVLDDGDEAFRSEQRQFATLVEQSTVLNRTNMGEPNRRSVIVAFGNAILREGQAILSS